MINGGLTSTSQVSEQLQHVDGVMVGRAAYQNPYWLAELEQSLFAPAQTQPSRASIFSQYCDYMLQQEQRGISMKSMSRHVIGLYQGRPGARRFRRILSAAWPKQEKNSADVLNEALESVSGVSL